MSAIIRKMQSTAFFTVQAEQAAGEAPAPGLRAADDGHLRDSRKRIVP